MLHNKGNAESPPNMFSVPLASRWQREQKPWLDLAGVQMVRCLNMQWSISPKHKAYRRCLKSKSASWLQLVLSMPIDEFKLQGKLVLDVPKLQRERHPRSQFQNFYHSSSIQKTKITICPAECNPQSQSGARPQEQRVTPPNKCFVSDSVRVWVCVCVCVCVRALGHWCVLVWCPVYPLHTTSGTVWLEPSGVQPLPAEGKP